MKVVTFFGSEGFILAVLPLLYWCVDRRKGARIAMTILVSAFVNLWVKAIFKQPRPYNLDPSVGLAVENTYGLPSGHSQTSATFWGIMAPFFPRAVGIAAAIILPLLIGFSRIYLGVHFPTDVFAGWALGGLIVALYYKIWPKIEALLQSWGMRYRLIAAAGVTIAMNFLLPLETPSSTTISGAFLGAAVGFALVSNSLRFDARGTLAQKAMRYAVGLAGTALWYFGPKLVLGEPLSSQNPLAHFIRYAIVGLWVAYGAPWVFLKLKLVEIEA
jgi:membrane-associated phospholipid phosphatase